MKKAVYILLGFLLGAGVVAYFCHGSKSKTEGIVDSASVDTISVETKADTISGENAYAAVSMALPTGDSEISKTIRENLINLMGTQIYKDADFFQDGTMHGDPFKGNTQDLMAMSTFYATNIFKVVDKIASDDIKDGTLEIDPNETEVEQRYCQVMDLKKYSEASNYVVFDDLAFSFFGGNKGGTFTDNFIIFNRTTGAQVKSILKPGSVNKMQPLLLEGFKVYFKAIAGPDDPPITTDQDVLDIFAMHEPGNIVPLPSGNTIVPTKDGLAFCYMEYDMGSSTLGEPAFTIPYEEVKQFMTQEALDLLK